MHLELYYYNACPFCRMVLHTIDLLGIQDKIVMKDIMSHRAYSAELRELNGHTQVPCLVIDGKPMLESSDINDFLNDNFRPSSN
ncbi:MAG: glutathione S-transferase N-terminal domain-containing protein [SAR324 cluster bacterium]|nr:glutathione S-transferase N-terminal domain-containing protein [SAR324 cluster bacterium]